MEDRSRLARVGAVLAGTCALFVGLITFVLGSASSSRVDVYYILFTENVKGMVIGSKVNFQGVPAGSVSDIRFQDGRSLVEVKVDPERCEVQEVTRARLDRLLVTGQVTVELEGYGKGRPRLPAGSFITPTENAIAAMTRSLPDVLEGVPAVLVRAEAVLGGLDRLLQPDNRARIGRALEGIGELAERSARLLGEVEAPLTEALMRLPGTVDRVEALLDEARGAARGARELATSNEAWRSVRGAERAVTAVAGMCSEMQALAIEARGLFGGSRGSWHEALLSIRDAMRDVRGLARLLQLAPSSVVYGRRPPEAAAAVPPGGGR